MADVYIGRQPIFDRNLNVVGYELLYRSEDMDSAQFLDGNQATAAVVSNAFLEIGFERLVGDKLAFINLTRAFITGKYPLPQRQEHLVLEVLEDITIDQELIESIARLRDAGFTVALDDVTTPEDIEKIIDLAHIVKVDYMLTDRSKLPQHVPIYKRSDVLLLAEKIENQQEFDECLNLGFDYFQGYFLCKPKVIKEKKLTSSKIIMLEVLAEIQHSDIEFQQIENSIQRDVTMSFKLLRLINSAFYGVRSEITSIKQAVTLLGLSQIQSWISLLLLSESDNKPHELIKTAMIRAKMCEYLALSQHISNSEVHFTVGLFSVLDALMDMTLEEILAQVPLADDVKKALIHHEGDLGHMLQCVLAYEAGDWDSVSYRKMQGEEIAECYLEAVEWADEAVGVLFKV